MAKVIPITAAWFFLFWTGESTMSIHLSDGWWRLFTSTVLLKFLLMWLALSQTIYSNVVFTTTNGFEDDTGGRRTANSTLIRFGSDASGCPMTTTWVALKAELFRILGQNCFEIDSFLWRCNIIMVKSTLNSCSNLLYAQKNRWLRHTSAIDFYSRSLFAPCCRTMIRWPLTALRLHWNYKVCRRHQYLGYRVRTFLISERNLN